MLVLSRTAVSLMVVWICTCQLAHAQNPPFKSYDPLKYKSMFLERPAGTVAFLPRLGSAKYIHRVSEFYVLPESGLYKLPAKGNYFFQVNHVTGKDEVSFLKCVIYTVYQAGISPKEPILLTRNGADWEGRKYPDGTDRIVARRDIFLTPNVSLAEFRTKHAGDDLRAVDKMIDRRIWHAWPSTDEDAQGSWDLRNELARQPPAEFNRLLELCGLTPETMEVAMAVHLLHFRTATHPNTKNPLYFRFNGDHALGAYMSLRSPLLPDFTRDYYLKFDRK